jgi:hypothetical protein
MDGASKSRVSEALTQLTERYRPVEVNQTSVGVPTPVYEQVAGAGCVDAYVRVRNDDGELLVTPEADGSEMGVPSVQLDLDGSSDSDLVAAFEEATGVACSIEDLREVEIVTVYDQNDEDRKPVYVLEAHFTGSYRTGSTSDEAFSWVATDGSANS